MAGGSGAVHDVAALARLRFVRSCGIIGHVVSQASTQTSGRGGCGSVGRPLATAPWLHAIPVAARGLDVHVVLGQLGNSVGHG
jgi:hypothetical protein